MASSMSPPSSSPLAAAGPGPLSGLPADGSGLATAGSGPSPGLLADASGLAAADTGLPADGSGLAAVVFAAVSEVDGNGTWSAVNTGRFDDDTSESEASPLSGAADDGLLGDSADGSGALSAGLWLTSPSKHSDRARIDLTQGLLPVLLGPLENRHSLQRAGIRGPLKHALGPMAWLSLRHRPQQVMGRAGLPARSQCSAGVSAGSTLWPISVMRAANQGWVMSKGLAPAMRGKAMAVSSSLFSSSWPMTPDSPR